ncbi:MAG: transcriptional regulator [Planctomycetota bacterium]|nr:MAG: transcriptional regulator [Planctomycetota bacterium]
MLELQALAELSRLFAEPTRLRLLSLLAREELTVAELTAATRLSQSRVSTHLARLREAGVVRLRKAGTRTFHALDEPGADGPVGRLWKHLQGELADGLLVEDADRLRAVLDARQESWADSVAGSMERHYSPGRTWEAALRGVLGLLDLGHVLDIASGDGALSELLAPRARSVTCLDRSERVLDAAGRRFAKRGPANRAQPSTRRSDRSSHARVRLLRGDMHRLPFHDARFDEVLLVNSLSYADDPRVVVNEAARVLRPGGKLVAVTLATHAHEGVAHTYGHRRLGFDTDEFAALLRAAGLDLDLCTPTSRERRAPHFRVLTAHARRPLVPANSGDPT